MKKLIQRLNPPKQWRVPVIVLLGIIVGITAYAIRISNAVSYLSDDPKTCVNCHIMAPQYATWYHSAHREVTSCNDCHVPHNNVFNKYFFKAKDGMRHATIFTMRREPQVIFIHEAGQKVVQNNCIRCHENVVGNSKIMAASPNFHASIFDRQCWECHRETPHGRVNSLSSVPNARVPLPESPVPDWLREVINEKTK